MPITIQRSSWDNARAIFVLGLKAGHLGHMDGGSFVLDADTVRWAYDLGAENYHRIVPRKMDLWNMSQSSDRWTIFRLGGLAHDALAIDGVCSRPKAGAKVVSFHPLAELDLTSLYPAASKVVKRRASACQAASTA